MDKYLISLEKLLCENIDKSILDPHAKNNLKTVICGHIELMLQTNKINNEKLFQLIKKVDNIK